MDVKKEIKDFTKFMIPASAAAGLTMLFGPVPVLIGLGTLALCAKRREAQAQ